MRLARLPESAEDIAGSHRFMTRAGKAHRILLELRMRLKASIENGASAEILDFIGSRRFIDER